ncbi:MAG: diguanylate cyclase [Alphaproteobacteria bacterium]|nr:diguanylate cyclase [Alphaproteobacteria bacterium]
MSALPAALLAQTIDDHVAWLSAWMRVACLEVENHAALAEDLPAPESFAIWREEATKTLQDQPALTKLVELYDQLHRIARLALVKTPDGGPVARGDVVTVTMKFQELFSGLRRMERAFAAADSGLDTLTGLRARATARDDLARELSRFQRSGKPFCLALMDIDHFKKINDTYGHDAGDKVLSAVANHISRNLRPFDDAWRWGGEEFLLCLKETDLTGGATAVERVRAALEKSSIVLGDGKAITVTASFGVAAPGENPVISEILKQADAALYRAKDGGRNRVEKAVMA